MADPLSGIAIIICIAFGVLTFVLLFIFANRQIKRFSLKSKSGPHTPIAQDAPKSVQNEINRRLDIVKSIAYHPTLLKKSDEVYFSEKYSGACKPCLEIFFHIYLLLFVCANNWIEINELIVIPNCSREPIHLYRMKAVDSIVRLDATIHAADPSRTRPFNQDYRVYLVRLFQSGLFGQLEITVIHRYADLYELARHEPGEFNEDHLLQFMDLMSQIQASISTRNSIRQPPSTLGKNASSSAHTSDTTRHFTNGKVPAVPSVLQVESSLEDKTATYETSV